MLKQAPVSADRCGDERPLNVSTIAEETKQAIHAASRPASARQRRRIAAVEPSADTRFVADDHGSRITALVFQAVLFCAMCLSLLAVIQQAKSVDAASSDAGTGVDDAPPAVFVNAD